MCLTLSITLCISAREEQRALVFAAVFVVVWVGAAIVTLNAQLLGGTMCDLAICLPVTWRLLPQSSQFILPKRVRSGLLYFSAQLRLDPKSRAETNSGHHRTSAFARAVPKSYAEQLLRILSVGTSFAWSTRVSVVFFSEVISTDRRALAIYPVFGFYAFIASQP